MFAQQLRPSGHPSQKAITEGTTPGLVGMSTGFLYFSCLFCWRDSVAVPFSLES
jgi:hypothetical protein